MMSASFPTNSHRPTMSRATPVLLTIAAIILCLGVVVFRHNLRGDIEHPLRQSSSSTYELLDTTGPLTRLHTKTAAPQTSQSNDNEYFVFLQKFPLQNTWQLLFHTEVVVCPRSTFDTSSTDFLSTLDQLAKTISSSNNNNQDDKAKVSFVQVPEEQWSQQTNTKCVQLGYGGASCPSTCCGSPHGNENINYALSSRQAVIGNAMGDAKQLYLYGVSDSISGMDAYRAVCVDDKKTTTTSATDDTNQMLPTCVSHWAGTDYNPLTNNCNTFTSTILKCVYGLSDDKPKLGISDMVNVVCPMEKRDDGMDVPLCLIPAPTTKTSLSDAADGVDVEQVE